jgi:gamma-glutamyltranspeptidase/glutathione hydrolase
MGNAAAASTHPAAAEAALSVFQIEPGEAPGTAIDAVVAGVLALAARSGGVLLGSGTILLGGTGEGLLAFDGRARQPGIGAARPRGFLGEREVPDAARIAAPLLPAALSLAHAGRGVRTRTALVRAGVAAAQALGKVDDARIEALRAFGREGAAILLGGPIQEALLGQAARSLGGLLTREDLEALRPSDGKALTLDAQARRWAIAPWAEGLRAGLGATTFAEPAVSGGEIAIVAASDARGAVAIASVFVPSMSIHLGEMGLSVPPLARPVMRGVERVAPGSALPMAAPIGIAWPKHGAPGAVDLALGLGGGGAVETAFAALAEAASREAAIFDDVVARDRGDDTVVSGLFLDGRGRGRPIVDRGRQP